MAVGAPLFKMEGSEAPATIVDSTSPPPPPPTPSAADDKSKATTMPPVAATAQPSGSSEQRQETRIPLSRLQLRTAERLKDAQNTAATLTTFQDCDMGSLIEMREEYTNAFEKANGVPLGMMSAFVKAAALAIEQVPAVNGRIDEDSKEIVYHDYVDMNVAVASADGLVSPVIRNCEQLSFAEIETTIAALGDKARERSLALEDMAGGTFTLSNGGIYGSLLTTPSLTSPQSAVLGMHGIKMRPVEYQGQIVARPMMYLALTYDHRIIDGREAVTFLKAVADKVADPRRLILGL